MKKRILIVDDEPSFTRMIRRGLEKTGHYSVTEVNDPTKTLATARNVEPDLILLDILMQNIDGAELVSYLLADEGLKQIPMVFLTTLVTDMEVSAGTWGDACRTYLPKPVKWDQLLHCIEMKTQKKENVV